MCPAVKIQLLNVFRLELKIKEIVYHGETVGEAIARFESDYIDALPGYLKNKEKDHLNEAILILVNGSNIKNLDGMDTRLKEGDEIQLSVPVIGG